MRYYCEYSPDKVNHVSPSVSMLNGGIERTQKYPKNILDLGCGNGRNSLYLTNRYGSNVVLVDVDEKMVGWATELFRRQGLTCVDPICSSVENFVSNPLMLKQIGQDSFDVVILSYVLQHIEPIYYPLILDFCKRICKGYIVLDVFWNPTRLGPGELIKIGSVSWYGLTYEELVTMLAPNFSIVCDRFLRTDVAILINMILKEGQTPLENVLKKNYEYYSGRARRYRGYGTSLRRAKRIINIDELESVKLLGSIYPSEFDLVRTEMMQWIQNTEGIKPSIAAAKFLCLCRINKIPVMFKEVTRDFGISTRKLMQIMSETDYVPALDPEDYIERLSKQLHFSDTILNKAKDLVGESLGGSSPTVRACCAVLKAAKAHNIKIRMSEVASALEVSTVAINLALKNERSDMKTLMKPTPSP